MIEEKGAAKLQIWDIGNEKEFHHMIAQALDGAHGVMFLFSLIDRQTLLNLDTWLPKLREKNPEIPILLVGTKLDLIKSRSVLKEKALTFALLRGCISYIEVSAKERKNIEDAFESMTKIMWDTKYST